MNQAWSWKGLWWVGDPLQLQENSEHQGHHDADDNNDDDDDDNKENVDNDDDDLIAGSGRWEAVGDRENGFPADYAVHWHAEDWKPGNFHHR